ncbi:MAG: ABC transporter ATP-binding protein [Burkholderiales bacterium]|nr:ABC transporter ATP-binding protein [Burkholderiales bacterium]
MLEVAKLSVAYGGYARPVLAVQEVSFTLAPGESLGIVGESGSGKSTLAHALLRLPGAEARITAGAVRFEGHDVATLPERDMRALRGRRIAMILQDPLNSLNPLLTHGMQIAEGPRMHEGLGAREATERARALLAAVRIADPQQRLKEYPHQISGGMRQRVAGAIALASSPSLLIADEPTTALDPTVQAQYLGLLKDLQAERCFALILITHDLGVVARTCDRIAVMYAGRFVETGPVEQVFHSPVHPYTRALLGSRPIPGRRAGALEAIGGQPPDPRALPAGCAFHPRCSLATEACRAQVPELRAAGLNAMAACMRVGSARQ